MRHEFTYKFIKSYHSFPNNIQLKFDKQLGYLLKNIKHPSLHAKKFDEAEGILASTGGQKHKILFHH